MDYYAEQSKKRLLNDKHECDVLAKAWAGVKRVKTKNGEDFKALGKNFEGANVRPKNYTPNEKEIRVYATDEKGFSYSDTIDIDKTIFDADVEQYKDRLIERGAYLYPYIEYTPDEIMARVEERINYYTKRAEELGKVLAEFDSVASKVVAMREEAEKFIKQYDIAYYELRKILREESK